jgi:hypothetical protein
MRHRELAGSSVSPSASMSKAAATLARGYTFGPPTAAPKTNCAAIIPRNISRIQATILIGSGGRRLGGMNHIPTSSRANGRIFVSTFPDQPPSYT